jgi:hypothetical protein
MAQNERINVKNILLDCLTNPSPVHPPEGSNQDRLETNWAPSIWESVAGPCSLPDFRFDGTDMINDNQSVIKFFLT